jgi:hypothetical protein
MYDLEPDTVNGQGSGPHGHLLHEPTFFRNEVETFYHDNRRTIDYVRAQLRQGSEINVRNKTWTIEGSSKVIYVLRPRDDELSQVLCTSGVKMLTRGSCAFGGPALVCTKEVAECLGVTADAIQVLANADCLGGVLRRKHRTYVLPTFADKLAFMIGTLLGAGFNPNRISASLRASWLLRGRRQQQ